MTSTTPDPNQNPQTPPTTPEEALAIFHSRYAEPKLADGSPAELGVHEFDEGFLIYPVLPPVEEPVDGPPRPAEPGGGKIVVSKETGKSYGIPNFPTEQAIALYKKNRARERERNS
ncbi:hypothetical protein [Streptomyces cavernicola]|uniref:Uncharacterized protein n=1 Tax=Streptomyces cavernicola TaxID=3043613 RepID=A0ABT6SG69_9ACTN|nr:hypothetical protein [Streptomyces sp. B-S-A6]MDI3407187.1 hypothetical protein [Streptomyces sp. B-S-A6]